MKSNIIKSFGIFFLSLLVLSACRNEDNKIEPTCFDEVRNQGELRVDCGGPNCPECPPSCDDRIWNQDEYSPATETNGDILGIDCGGEACGDNPCSTCEDGIRNAHWVFNPNLTNEDYQNYDTVATDGNGNFYHLVWESGIDCGAPCNTFCEFGTQCDDGIQNGDEEGIDCGGTCGNPCPPPTCNDGIQNGTETGIDCGDAIEPSVCGPCPDPSCTDGIQNIHIEYSEDFLNGYMVVVETGIDCDGNPFTACPDCPLPTCYDGVQNQNEFGVDCGGPCATPCNPNPSCANGIMDGAETGIDCDADPNTSCPPCAQCGPVGSGVDGIKNGPEYDVDCVDYPIPDYPCPVCPSCHDEVLNSVHNVGDLTFMYELDVDCGTEDCGPCDQELVVAAIGELGGEIPFRDQYSYNRILAAAGQDTVSLGNQYPGLKVEAAGGGFEPTYLKVTAHQGIETDAGLYLRKVTMYIPRPESMVVEDPFFDGAQSIPMIDPSSSLVFGCTPSFGIEVPFITYETELVGNPGAGVDFCYYSFNLPPPNSNSEFEINYLRGYLQTNYRYTTGNINGGTMVYVNPLGDDLVGSFNDLTFKFHYYYFL